LALKVQKNIIQRPQGHDPGGGTPWVIQWVKNLLNITSREPSSPGGERKRRDDEEEEESW